jgi:hypothetical protein
VPTGAHIVEVDGKLHELRAAKSRELNLTVSGKFTVNETKVLSCCAEGPRPALSNIRNGCRKTSLLAICLRPLVDTIDDY